MDRLRSYKLISVLLGLVATFILGEGVLSLVLPSQNHFYVWLPNLKATFRPNPEIFPGIMGEARFYINSSGIRGDEFANEQKYRILALGGSTTQCLDLDLDEVESWPYLLQKKLSESKRVISFT